MKRISVIFILILLVACKTNTTVDYAILQGKIENKGELNKLTLTNNDRDFKYEIDIAEDGSFQDTLNIASGVYTLSLDRRKYISVALFDGDYLIVKSDAENFADSLKFEGQGANENILLQSINSKMKDFDENRKNDYTLEEEAYKSLLLNQKSKLMSLLNSSEVINPLFKEQQTRYINYWFIHNLQYYQSSHRYFAEDPDFVVSNDFLEEAKHLDFQIEEDYRGSRYYNNLVNIEHREMADSLVNDGFKSVRQARLEVATQFQSDYIRNDLLYQTIMGALGFANEFTADYNTYLELTTNETQKAKVQEKYNQVKALEKGNPSPAFTNYENYSGGKTSLEDFKGKYVYIDVWATWCGPCKAEIPYLIEVETKYHDNSNIAFVSISVDKEKDYDKWKTMVKEKGLGGVQLIADNVFNSDFIKAYQIMGIPQFILIDPEGNIVNRNAPRPSSSELLDVFAELNL
ncbi:TlpA disulfide reductase family protein [Aestuariibaculum sp. YM273]|uniref:TlpA family protein disulfide reductase n=1 Tax=Aestuariibaculum sp. YM273 TaxID=3070659 RepID=UPI0027DB4D3F|nr:TlpA disulfide reductase family protein [Aestuariibaculum sp. YM273]WMI64122.1 TlpA disulfide reductase family protein [Aestuariibaculum sp. YM273]